MTFDAAAEHRLRELAPRVLGAVARRCGDFGAAEDAVQEALLAAAVDWRQRGEPDNPGGWLFHVACRRLADHIEAEQARRRREAEIAACAADEAPVLPDLDEFADEDDTLVLLFMCCHPTLAPAAAIALVLRAVGGLTTAQIAAAFLVPEATMAQRISRAKQAIQASGVPFALPSAAERWSRLSAVLHVLYLMFNEGYASTSGAQLLRVDLSGEAIRLARLLHRLQPDHAPEQAPQVAEIEGLLALLLLTDARRTARTGADGELIPLHEQDRSLWDRGLIAEGTALVTTAMRRGAVGSYQVQAAIGSLHDEAATFEATDWPQILMLYELLARMGDNPMVQLNRAVAFAMVHGPTAGLQALDELAAGKALAGHYRLDAVRAHLFEMAGDRASALRHYREAAAGTANLAERSYLAAKAARLQPAD